MSANPSLTSFPTASAVSVLPSGGHRCLRRHARARSSTADITPDEWRAFRLINGIYGQRQEGVYMIRVEAAVAAWQRRRSCEAFADVAEKCAGSGIGHVTTRQNIQLHFVKEADAENALRLLADVGLTTKRGLRQRGPQHHRLPVRRRGAARAFDASPYATRSPATSCAGRTRRRCRASSSRVRRLLRHRLTSQAQINDLGFLDHRRRARQARVQGLHRRRPVDAAQGRRSWSHEFLPVDRGARGLGGGGAHVPPARQPQGQGQGADQVGDAEDRHGGLHRGVQEAERAAIRAEGGRPLAVAPAPTAARRPRRPERRCEALPEFAAFADDQRSPAEAGGFLVGDRPPCPRGTSRRRSSARWRSCARKFGEGEIRTDQRAEPGDALHPDLAPWPSCTASWRPSASGRRAR